MKKKILILTIFILVCIFIPSIGLNAQEGASIYLTPSNGTFYIGSTFNVSVFVNTGGQDINTIKVNLKFDPKKLQVSSPTAGRSFVSLWLSQPGYSNTEGTLSFSGGVPTPGINTSSGLISTIVFRVIGHGTTAISVADAAVYLNDGKGTDVLNSVGRGIYDLVLPPPEGPKVFSLTHPDQNKWYKNNNPTLNWEKEDGVTDFSYSIDKDFQGVPDNISEGNKNAVSYSNIEDGIWYFHVKAKNGNIWGGISHYALSIDTTPPAEFNIEVEPNLNTASVMIVKQPIISFITTDALSGVDHYEVKTIPLREGQKVTVKEESKGESGFFLEAVSPHKLTADSGLLEVIVRAYDRAGNWQDSVEKIKFVAIGKFVVTQFGINFWIFFVRWWVIILIISVLISTILIIIYLRKRSHK